MYDRKKSLTKPSRKIKCLYIKRSKVSGTGGGATCELIWVLEMAILQPSCEMKITLSRLMPRLIFALS